MTAGTMVVFGDCTELRRKGEIALETLREVAPRYGGLEYIDLTYPDHPAVKPGKG